MLQLSVLLWSNADFHDPEALGDVLADAVEGGVGIVVGAYALNDGEGYLSHLLHERRRVMTG